MNSTFRARWLASSEVISQVLFTSGQPKKNKMAFVAIFFLTNKVTLWATSYSAFVVYTKTIIHLSVFAARQISKTIHLHFGESLLIIFH